MVISFSSPRHSQFSWFTGWASSFGGASPDHVQWFDDDSEGNENAAVNGDAVVNEEAFPDAPFDEESFDDDATEWILSTSFETSEGGSAVRPIGLDHKLETVTIVTGIDKRIHLGRLCDANPDIFGVRSQGTAEFTLVFSA
jgi:hypothetical protein